VARRRKSKAAVNNVGARVNDQQQQALAKKAPNGLQFAAANHEFASAGRRRVTALRPRSPLRPRKVIVLRTLTPVREALCN
jgi:hypothetical protein